MKIKLSITRDYCPDWGIREGIRELVQNWLDARTPDCRTRWCDDQLVFWTDASILTPADVGLLGRTSKRNDPAARGQFGEGLKIGVLALVRAGLDVLISSGDYAYKAELAPADELDGEEVLCFERLARLVPVAGTHVAVNLPKADWQDISPDFLDLRDSPPRIALTPTGEILLDEAERGRVYVKGIFVRKYEDLTRGYNLTGPGVKVDRDRRLVDDFDLTWELGRITAAAQPAPDELLDALEQGGREVRHVHHHLTTAQRRDVAEEFDERHGALAVPGDAPAGMRSVATSDALREVLAEHKATKIAQRASAFVRKVPWEELTGHEQIVSDRVEFLLEQTGIVVGLKSIAEFESPETTHANGHIARSALFSEIDLLRVAVAAIGGDIAETYLKIIASLRGWSNE